MNDFDDKCSACACGKEFTHKKTLYAHLRKVHQIEPLSKPEPKFECNICDKLFARQSSLSRHTRITHYTGNELDSSTVSARKKRLICPNDTCNEELLNYVRLREHLSKQHGTDVECEDLTFNSNADFEQWKDQIQQKTLSLYTKNTAMKQLKSGVNKIFYDCHRSYAFKNQGKNIRATKSIGSNKIGKACPSRLEVTSTTNTRESIVSVKYWKTHCGHTEDIRRITLNRDIRMKIAGKLKEGVSFDRVLNSIRDPEENNHISPRVLLLNRKDMHNIVRDFNIDYPTKLRTPKRHDKLWAEEITKLDQDSPVLYYKGQKETGHDDSDIKSDPDVIQQLERKADAIYTDKSNISTKLLTSRKRKKRLDQDCVMTLKSEPCEETAWNNQEEIKVRLQHEASEQEKSGNTVRYVYKEPYTSSNTAKQNDPASYNDHNVDVKTMGTKLNLEKKTLLNEVESLRRQKEELLSEIESIRSQGVKIITVNSDDDVRWIGETQETIQCILVEKSME